LPPWLRLQKSQITQALEKDNLPVIPVYPIGGDYVGGHSPDRRMLTSEVGKDTNGINIDVPDASYRICTVHEFLAAAGLIPIPRTSGGCLDSKNLLWGRERVRRQPSKLTMSGGLNARS